MVLPTRGTAEVRLAGGFCAYLNALNSLEFSIELAIEFSKFRPKGIDIFEERHKGIFPHKQTLLSPETRSEKAMRKKERLLHRSFVNKYTSANRKKINCCTYTSSFPNN